MPDALTLSSLVVSIANTRTGLRFLGTLLRQGSQERRSALFNVLAATIRAAEVSLFIVNAAGVFGEDLLASVTEKLMTGHGCLLGDGVVKEILELAAAEHNDTVQLWKAQKAKKRCPRFEIADPFECRTCPWNGPSSDKASKHLGSARRAYFLQMSSWFSKSKPIALALLELAKDGKEHKTSSQPTTVLSFPRVGGNRWCCRSIFSSKFRYSVL